MNIIWQRIPDDLVQGAEERYEISNTGKVRSLRRKREKPKDGFCGGDRWIKPKVLAEHGGYVALTLFSGRKSVKPRELIAQMKWPKE